MCLILFSWKAHAPYELVIAANRDEFYRRPSAPAGFWDSHPYLLAGRDLEAGGTWMGISKTGRYAAITNYRDPSILKQNAPSRGELTTSFLTSEVSPQKFIEDLKSVAHQYNGFNLLVGDLNELWYLNNISGEARTILPGTYGLSNAFLDTSWPKVDHGKKLFKELLKQEIDEQEAFKVLGNGTTAPDELLPSTGIPYAWEKAISPIFIETDNYGTTCSTLMSIGSNKEVRFVEKNYRPNRKVDKFREFDFLIEGQ